MYLEMIFVKNKEQTTRQLQFKFDLLLAESVEICLFHERWIKTFYTQPFGQLCIKYVLVFYKNDLVQFCNNYFGGPWDHLSKLCHECGHKIDHLAWKPLISTRDSSFFRTLFKNSYRITSLLFFLVTWPHIMTQCEGFANFCFFFEFFMPVSKCGQNGGNDRS